MASPIQARSALGNTIRNHPGDDEAITAARVALKEANLRERIREAVAGWPPLTPEQRGQLALLLAPGGGSDAA